MLLSFLGVQILVRPVVHDHGGHLGGRLAADLLQVVNLQDDHHDGFLGVFLGLGESLEPFVASLGVVPVQGAGLSADVQGVVVLAGHVAGRNLLAGGAIGNRADHGLAESEVGVLAEGACL